MANVALVFPGQGSYFSGMGEELYNESSAARAVYGQASKILGYDVTELCFRESSMESQLRLAFSVQNNPAIFVTSYAGAKALEERCDKSDVGLEPSFLLGHSLGEYTAVAYSESIDFETSLRLVETRARLIANVDFGSTLVAVTSFRQDLDIGQVSDLCKSSDVYLALVNGPRQIVVGGKYDNITQFKESASQLTDAKLVSLPVSIAYHTPLIKSAALSFSHYLNLATLGGPKVPIIAHTSGSIINTPDQIKAELYQSMFNAVNWVNCVERAIRQGVETFINIGPGTVLSGLIRKIDRNVQVLNVGNAQSLDEVVKAISRNR
jgi:[acyl-carrier-protein] S-malonyltransferase